MKELIRSYKRFFYILKILSYLGNNKLSRKLAYFLTSKSNPYLFHAEKIKSTLTTPALGLSTDCQAKTLNSYINQYVIFGLLLFSYKKLNSQWINKNIRIINIDTVHDLINQKEGLFLTYHHHYQHLLCSLLGILKNKMYVMANAPETSPVYIEMKQYIDKLHNDTEQHFYGGQYVFVNPESNYLRILYRMFASNGLVFSLNDNLVLSDKRTQSAQFFNKLITIPTGTIEIALKMKKPIYCGLLEWTKENIFEFDLIKVNNPETVADVTKTYIQFLEQKVKHNPALWEGWQWFQDCHEIKGNL